MGPNRHIEESVALTAMRCRSLLVVAQQIALQHSSGACAYDCVAFYSILTLPSHLGWLQISLHGCGFGLHPALKAAAKQQLAAITLLLLECQKTQLQRGVLQGLILSEG